VTQDPSDLGLGEAARAIRDGRLTAEALARACLARIRRHDGRIRAWAWLDEDRALEQARRADAELRAGRSRGPLHGVPIGIKDVIHTRGIPTRMGSPIFAAFVPASSAHCVERLERAGAFVLGKTATTEFANQHPAATTNPWNVGHSPGGSSSGSAAAVAAGMTAAALGTQTRGSTIRPAVYCGIVGFKPTFGLVSRSGVHELSWTLDHVGVLARSVPDAALVASAIAGHDPRDRASLSDAMLPPDLHVVAPLARAPRLAAVRSPAWRLADPAQQSLFEANCATLRRAGAQVEAVELPEAFEAANDAARTIQLAEIGRNFAALHAAHAHKMSATFRALCERGMQVTALDYWAALDARAAVRRHLADLLAAFDAIVTPPATGEAPPGLASTGDAAFCTLWTLCGVPAVAFPTALGPHGLPMGLQVVGAELADRRTLEVAQWCRDALPFEARPHD
jgi:Asp-tRNA(Asn)/Glu-tRNA(Gln) amidotransferase A subunit family amidase